jgi:hypothetical protein
VEYLVQIDPSWIGPTGDVRIDFGSPTFRAGTDLRDLGFTADFVRVELPGGFVLPSLDRLAALLFCALLLYLLMRAVWLTPNAAGLLTGFFLLGCAGAVAVQRLLLTVFSVRMLFTLLCALLVAILVEAAARWLVRSAGLGGPGRVPEWAWAGLRALLAISVALKVGGVLYPHTFIIDAYFHLKEITYMAEGRPWEQFFGKNLALSVMPRDEWGSARAFIPYSPFFYVVAAPLHKLAVPTALSVPVVMAAFEGIKVALVFLLGIAFSRGRRAASLALGAAAIYAFTPATFLLQQWGNWPTQLSLWLVTLWAVITCLFWRRITSPPVWIASTGVLALALLSYTVTAAYTGVFAGMLVAGGILFAGRPRTRWMALALSLLVACVVALVVFYGQYVDDVLGETLPTFGQAVEEQGKLTTLRSSWPAFLTGTLGQAMQSYNLAVVYGLGLAGAAWVLFRGRRSQVESRKSQFSLVGFRPATFDLRLATWKVWLVAWLLTFPLFTFLDYYVDQALKEFWYALPAIAVVASGWLLLLLARGRGARPYLWLAWLIGATLVWQSLSLWVFRLLFHNR